MAVSRLEATAPANRHSPVVLLSAMSLVSLTVAVLQTAVVPILGVMARQLNASTVDVSWVVTANLLAAAATTPLLGRLADLYSKKRVLMMVLGVVLAGSILAATTASLPVLILARVLQGASFSLYPIGVSILREELPGDRLMSAMAVLSGVLGFGGGMGLVITGLLMRDGGNYHRVFWFTTAFSVLTIIVAARVVPQRPATGVGSVDWAGAAGLGFALSMLLLAITQGPSWGWSAPRTMGSATAGLLSLGVWWWWERRCPHPLMSTTMLSRRPILLTNIATVSVGMGLYFGFLGLTDLVQMPISTGYGFGASVLKASVVYLFPGAMAGFLTATASGRYIDRFGARPVLLVGATTGVVGFAMLAFAHRTTWQLIVGIVLINAYISLAYGALPTLVIREVQPDETGVATSINAIARSVGASVAAAVVAVLLSRHGTGSDYPPERSFTLIFALGSVTGLIAMLLIAASRPRLRSYESVAEVSETRAMNHEWG